MRRQKLFAVFTLVPLLLLARVTWDVWRYEPATSPAGEGLANEIRGAIHVHSARSDGAGDLDAISRAARDAGLDFLVLTDHRDLEALGTDEYRNGVLLLKGVELSTRRGHLLVLDIERPDFRFDSNPEEAFDDVEDLGGFSIVAHPLSPHAKRRWTGNGPPRFDAVEIFNGSAGLRGVRAARALAGALASLLNPRYGLLRLLAPSRPNLAFWDEALSQRPGIVALAGSDAHGGIRFGDDRFFPFPNYRHLFDLASNHLWLEAPLTGNVPFDRGLVLSALRRGRLFVAIDGLADARGFLWSGTERGETLVLEVRAPMGPAEIVLRQDGAELHRVEGEHLSLTVSEPGMYRAEVFYRGSSPLDPSIPWIVSNPIAFGIDPPPASVPPSFEVPAGGVLVESFDGEDLVGWDTEADGRSHVSPPRRDGGAIAFDFTMGDQEHAERRSHCALTSNAPAGIASARAISFRYRADGVFRFDLQLRDENPRSPDGIEPFRISLKTSSEWRRAHVPFEKLTSYHEQSDGRYDPDRAKGIAFYLDTATVRPGASGTLWFDDLRLHR